MFVLNITQFSSDCNITFFKYKIRFLYGRRRLKESKKRRYIDVNIPRNWEPYLEEALQKPKTQKEIEIKGFSKTYSGLGSMIIRDYLLDNTSYRFDHVNTHENFVTIVDRKIKHVIDVYLKNKNKFWCEYCDSQNCEHIEYAASLEEVRKATKKNKSD